MRPTLLLMLMSIAIPSCLTDDDQPPETCGGQRAPDGPGDLDRGCGEADGDADADLDADGDGDADADLDADGDGDGDADRELCTPGGPARVMVTECDGQIEYDFAVGTGPRGDTGLLCDEMVECDEDADCTLVTIDPCCGRDVAAVPVELAEALRTRIPACPDSPPECSGPCPFLDSLSAKCAEEGYCDFRYPPAN